MYVMKSRGLKKEPGCVTRIDFDGDPDPDADPDIFKGIFIAAVYCEMQKFCGSSCCGGVCCLRVILVQ